MVKEFSCRPHVIVSVSLVYNCELLSFVIKKSQYDTITHRLLLAFALIGSLCDAKQCDIILLNL